MTTCLPCRGTRRAGVGCVTRTELRDALAGARERRSSWPRDGKWRSTGRRHIHTRLRNGRAGFSAMSPSLVDPMRFSSTRDAHARHSIFADTCCAQYLCAGGARPTEIGHEGAAGGGTLVLRGTAAPPGQLRSPQQAVDDSSAARELLHRDACGQLSRRARTSDGPLGLPQGWRLVLCTTTMCSVRRGAYSVIFLGSARLATVPLHTVRCREMGRGHNSQVGGYRCHTHMRCGANL